MVVWEDRGVLKLPKPPTVHATAYLSFIMYILRPDSSSRACHDSESFRVTSCFRCTRTQSNIIIMHIVYYVMYYFSSSTRSTVMRMHVSINISQRITPFLSDHHWPMFSCHRCYHHLSVLWTQSQQFKIKPFLHNNYYALSLFIFVLSYIMCFCEYWGVVSYIIGIA